VDVYRENGAREGYAEKGGRGLGCFASLRDATKIDRGTWETNITNDVTRMRGGTNSNQKGLPELWGKASKSISDSGKGKRKS